ncbi:hydroxysqualene dehydroxylase HpnE [uncultured Methylibium sp.]|uniref:hydroxysqualene dehydroxylase HpnE n=1 Tax=uncultured Methylibium sp. TaxID=381093 RepID=UPI00345472D3
MADELARAVSPARLRVAVVGGGWAGLAAAVEACSLGHSVTLYEMAAIPGGRARCVPIDDLGFPVDNGQHILIGAYTQTLRLMRQVGVDPEQVLQRLPLTLLDAQGRGLRLPTGAALPAFVRGVLAAHGWSIGERLALLRAAGGWLARRFRCAPQLTVAELCAGLPPTVRRQLIDPLCVAALNTPADQASAGVFLRVLRDALFAGPGASDLLLPRVDLGTLWPEPAWRWLEARGAALLRGRRVESIERGHSEWDVDGVAHDRVVLACPAGEAARLASPHAPDWATRAGRIRHEPIVTVLLRTEGLRLPAPMLALDPDDAAPAQYVFDLAQLRDREPGAAGVFAFVISGAARAVERGLDATTTAVLAQARTQLATLHPGAHWRPLRSLAEKRATFLCIPRLRRPSAAVAPGLLAAGDYIDGPYPATLEGAVRSGIAAAHLL